MNNAQSDKKLLLSTARALKSILKSGGLKKSLRFGDRLRHTTSETDGWYIWLAEVPSHSVVIHLWIDRWTCSRSRLLYGGIYAGDSRGYKHLRRLTERAPIKHLYYEKDCEQRGDRWKLKKKMPNRYYAGTIMEDYSDDCMFLGIYEDPTNADNEGRGPLFAEHFVSFLLDLLGGAQKGVASSTDEEAYAGYENRRRVRMHLSRERDPNLAKKRKLEDGYKCQVCNFRYADKYGADLGATFAEAHHIIPLARLKGRVVNTIDDLITVCANCHRMLHRMDGKADDVKLLRRLIAKNAKR